MRAVVFDTHAVMAWLRRKPQAPFVSALLREAQQGRIAGYICVVNWGETYCMMARKYGVARAEAVLEEMAELPWEVCPADTDLTLAAARLKAACTISYADAFALACAQVYEAELVTGSPELLALEAAVHGVPILWPGVGATPEV